MNRQFDRLGQIETEDAHDRFGVNDISSGNKIKVKIKLSDRIHKGFYLVNGIQGNLYCFHIKNLLGIHFHLFT